MTKSFKIPGFFFAGEGRRYHGEILQSAVPNREVKMIRQSIGTGVLITPFNNPAAGVAWKLFPALLSGNAVIIKSHRDTPYIAFWYAKLFKDAGVFSQPLHACCYEKRLFRT